MDKLFRSSEGLVITVQKLLDHGGPLNILNQLLFIKEFTLIKDNII